MYRRRPDGRIECDFDKGERADVREVLSQPPRGGDYSLGVVQHLLGRGRFARAPLLATIVSVVPTVGLGLLEWVGLLLEGTTLAVSIFIWVVVLTLSAGFISLTAIATGPLLLNRERQYLQSRHERIPFVLMGLPRRRRGGVTRDVLEIPIYRSTPLRVWAWQVPVSLDTLANVLNQMLAQHDERRALGEWLEQFEVGVANPAARTSVVSRGHASNLRGHVRHADGSVDCPFLEGDERTAHAYLGESVSDCVLVRRAHASASETEHLVVLVTCVLFGLSGTFSGVWAAVSSRFRNGDGAIWISWWAGVSLGLYALVVLSQLLGKRLFRSKDYVFDGAAAQLQWEGQPVPFAKLGLPFRLFVSHFLGPTANETEDVEYNLLIIPVQGAEPLVLSADAVHVPLDKLASDLNEMLARYHEREAVALWLRQRELETPTAHWRLPMRYP